MSTHLEHDPVLFLRLLNHTHVAPHFNRLLDGAGPRLPQMVTSHTKKHSKKVFVCSSGRAPPSSTGLWYLRLLFLTVTHNTSQFFGVCHSFLLVCVFRSPDELLFVVSTLTKKTPLVWVVLAVDHPVSPGGNRFESNWSVILLTCVHLLHAALVVHHKHKHCRTQADLSHIVPHL